MVGEKLLTLPEVAERLGIARSTAYALARSGRLPSIRISRGIVRVQPHDLESFLEANRRAEGGAR